MTEWSGRPDGFPKYAPRPDDPTELYPLTRQAEQRTANHDRLKPYVFAAVAAALVILVASLATVIWIDRPAASSAAEHAPRPVAASPQRKPVEKAPPVGEGIVRDGIYLVGKEIKTGTYRTDSGPDCFWARLSNTSREDGSIITSGYRMSGQQYVTIAKGDRAFESRGCNSWVMVK